MKNSFKDRDLYCVWLGNEMSDSRKKCYDSIVKNSNVNVILITENNLNDYILKDHKLPIGFDILSPVHKADYLRAYLLNYYGGVYTDIKQTAFDFNPYFDILEKSDKHCIGYAETVEHWINYEPIKHNFYEYIGTGMSIHKPNTPLTNRWLYLIDKTITKKYDKLKKYPGTHLKTPEDFNASRYPFSWAELGPNQWHRAQHENFGTWLFGLPDINMNGYR